MNLHELIGLDLTDVTQACTSLDKHLLTLLHMHKAGNLAGMSEIAEKAAADAARLRNRLTEMSIQAGQVKL